MNLTVTARIVGGAGLVMLLLVALSFTGLRGVSSIEDGLNSVTDKSTQALNIFAKSQITFMSSKHLRNNLLKLFDIFTTSV